MNEINEALARRVLDVVDQGLVKGVGTPTPGKMCVEAAVNFAMGLPHGDEPTCVGYAVRRFKIRLNDSNWSSDVARTKGMRKLAIAQLGSDTIDQTEFVKILIDQTIRIVVPRALRSAAKLANTVHAAKLEEAAVRCEAEGSRQSCRLARAYAAAYAAADAYAAAAAAYAADAAYAAAYAADAAYAAADAAADAADAADADAARDAELMVMADIGLQALIKLHSPGCAFLHLCEVA